MISIFDVPPEEGWKTRIADLLEKYNEQKGTQMKKLKVNGVFASLQPGTFIIFRATDHDLVDYPKELYGQFFSKEAFLVHYSFPPRQ